MSISLGDCPVLAFLFEFNVLIIGGIVWLIYIDTAKLECDRMRGENQYDHVRRVLFEISSSRGSLECIDVGGSPKDLRSILDYRR
jgi:hypothetical protein